MKKILLALGATALAASSAHAFEFDVSKLATQADFHLLSEDAAAALAFKPAGSGAHLTGIPIVGSGKGLLGFEVSVTATATDVQSLEVLKKAANFSHVPSKLPTTSLHAQKGLPFGFDIGASYTVIPGTDINAKSAEVRYSFIEGGLVTPNIGVRLFYTQMDGIKSMTMKNAGADLAISKTILMLTPYAGAGVVQTQTTAPGTALAGEKFRQNRVYAGVNLSLLLINFGLEADRTGKDQSVSLKASFSF